MSCNSSPGASMIVQEELFRKFISTISFTNHGDKFEREFSGCISETFPNCEKFWQVFVTPMTQRMIGYPDSPANSINLRESISPEVENITNSHYSMYVNFVYAFDHLGNKCLSSLEDIYVHLGAVCDLAEAVIENWYLLMLKNQGKEPEPFVGLSKEQFLAKADKWYQEEYQEAYDYYLNKGKYRCIRLPSRKDVITTYLGKKNQIRRDYAKAAQKIRQFRNVVVHNVKIGKIEMGGKQYVPKISKIGDYKSWENIRNAVEDKKIIVRDFAEPFVQAKQDILELSTAINNLWDLIIADFLREFYSPKNGYLRSLYKIDFQSGPTVINLDEPNVHQTPPSSTPPSGTYNSGGSAFWQIEEDDL